MLNSINGNTPEREEQFTAMPEARKIIIALIGAFLTGISVMAGCYFSSAELNRSKYPVLGVDVSNYQGLIDWDKLDEQNISFAFIKATEGSGHVDESARRNLERASETDIKNPPITFSVLTAPAKLRQKIIFQWSERTKSICHL